MTCRVGKSKMLVKRRGGLEQVIGGAFLGGRCSGPRGPESRRGRKEGRNGKVWNGLWPAVPGKGKRAKGKKRDTAGKTRAQGLPYTR